MASDISITGGGSKTGYADAPNHLKIHMGGLNVSLLQVAFEGPTKPECLLTTLKDGSVDCCYKTSIPGDYQIHIMFDEEHVEGSPFNVNVLGELPEDYTAKVKVTGHGLREGRNKMNNEVVVDAREADIGASLQVTMEGPSKPEINFKNNPNGTTSVVYKPAAPGQYKLHLKYLEIPVPGSPFSIRVKN